MATFDSVQPYIIIQRFGNGDACTGVPYTGLDAGVRDPAPGSPLTGMVHLSQKSGAEPGAIDGGEFDLSQTHPGAFGHLTTAWIKLPGATQIDLKAEDEYGIEYTLATVSSDEMVQSALDSWFLLPSWKIKVEATGSLTGDGAIYLVVGNWTSKLSFTRYLP